MGDVFWYFFKGDYSAAILRENLFYYAKRKELALGLITSLLRRESILVKYEGEDECKSELTGWVNRGVFVLLYWGIFVVKYEDVY